MILRSVDVKQMKGDAMGCRTVLITGGLGYIGSVLSQVLGKQGIRCIAYDTGFFKDCYLYSPGEPEIILRDTRQFQRKDLEGVDAVVHLAAISNDPFGSLSFERIYDPTRSYALHIARLCKEAGAKFIFSSSCSVYGKGAETFLTEESAIFPQTPYSLNKLQVEEDLAEICDKDFSPVIFRFATVYGLSSRMRFDLVVNMLVGMAVTTGKIVLNSDGKAWRPHVHIKDVCKAIKCGVDLEYHDSNPLILNVGDTRENFQVLDIARMVQESVPGCDLQFLQDRRSEEDEKVELIRDHKIQDGVDTRTYKVSFELIHQVLPDFQCGWTVRRGIGHMVEVFQTMQLTEKQFKNIGFYRLQRMERLYSDGLLTEDLYWKSGSARS